MSKPKKTVQLIIEPNGAARHLVDEVSERFGSAIGPKLSTQRASHVESWFDLSPEAKAWLEANGWCCGGCCDDQVVDPNAFWADLLPSGGPVLGPYDKYNDAIAAEIKWLQERGLPTR